MENVAPSGSLPEDRLASGLALEQLPGLDGVRAIAVFLVVFYHAGARRIPGELGFLVLFELSAFLITWSLLEEHDQYGRVSLERFYTRRALRIFPAFYAYWAFIIALMLIVGNVHWPQAIASFFHANNYYQAIFGDPNTGLSHTWWLGIAVQFYLLWPIAFIALRRLPRERTLRLLLGAIVVVWLYRWLLIFVVKVDQGYVYEAFDPRVDHLLAGCALAFALKTGSFAKLWDRLGSNVAWSIATVGLIAASVVLANTYGSSYRNAVGFVIDPVLIALLLPQLFIHHQAAVWSWLSWRWLRYLGCIWYSVYLYHQVTPSFANRAFADGSAGYLVFNAVLVVIAATGSYYVVERPFV